MATSDRKLAPFTPAQERFGNVVIKVMSTLNTWVYRATGGRVGGRFLRGAPVLLLTTTGRKSGERRTAPLLYLADQDRFVIVASKGGFSHHPAWYLNLEKSPDVTVQVGSDRREMRARIANDTEKQHLWPKLVAMYRDYDDYQARTDRKIPVVVLEGR